MNQTIVWGICLFEWNLASSPFSSLKFSFAKFAWQETEVKVLVGVLGCWEGWAVKDRR